MTHPMRALRDLVEDTIKSPVRDDIYVFYHFEADDKLARVLVRGILLEDKTIDLGKGRSLMFHKAHNPPQGQDHVHFCVKGAKMYALNKDGSAHDRSHGVIMQRWAIEGMKAHFPDFKVPADGLIEALLNGPERGILLEGTSNSEFVPPDVLAQAENLARDT